MKDNNKNRKLNFIREKNSLRLGITKFSISSKFSEEIEDLSFVVDNLKNELKHILIKKFNIKLRNFEFKTGYVNDDCIMDVKTIIATMHNLKTPN